MKQKEHFEYSTGVIAYPVLFVLILWIVFWFEVRFGMRLSKFGIYPQTIEGMRGILLSPFLHGDIKHLYHNSIPLFVLSVALFYFYRPIAWKVLFWGVLCSGLLTWLIGRPSYHIGASGLIYVLVSFTFFKGVFAKHYRLIALSLLVIFLYGSMIWYTLPIEQGISWEGHLSGLLTGLLFAIGFRKHVAKPKKYIWEEANYDEENDPFLKHFDENGNFIEHIEPDPDVEEESDSIKLSVNYIYKTKED